MVKKSSASSPPVELKRMSSAAIKNRQWTDRERDAVRRAAATQAAGDDSDIDFSDIPRLSEAQLASMIRFQDRPRKTAVSLRLDPKVLDWLKSKGPGHLTRINDILLNLMDAEARRK